MDVLTDVLDALDLRGWLASRTEIAPPWRFDFAASRDSTFHVLNFGGGYVRVAGLAEPLRVEDGDVVVFPHGHAHTLCDALTSPLIKASPLDYDDRQTYTVFPFEGDGPKSVLLCGAFRFAHPHHSPLLRGLPPVLHIRGERGRVSPDFADIVAFIARESASRRPGADVMLRRLTEMLFIQVIRVWLAEQAAEADGWLAALRDRPISSALGLIHQSPAHGWTVEELAAAVGLSRTAFSTRFARLVGEPPITYLIRWRMYTAARLLKNDVNVDLIARQVGYDSPVAFRKAFTREVGVPPARFRKQG